MDILTQLWYLANVNPHFYPPELDWANSDLCEQLCYLFIILPNDLGKNLNNICK
jgi:hypothetical protein